MRINNLFESATAGGTSSGSVASVSKPLGKVLKRAQKPGTNALDGSSLFGEDQQVKELSNEKLGQYKKAAGADASAADQAGDTKKGNKRFKGIVKATNKQFANDAKKNVKEGVGVPFRGVGGAFNRGDDERHDLDPTDWYFVKDGKMFAISVYPNQEREATARGYSRTRDAAKAKASQQGVAEGYYDLPNQGNVPGMEPIDFSSKPSFKELVTRYTQLVYQGHASETSPEEDEEYDAIEQYVAKRFGEKGSAHLQKAGEVSYWGRDDKPFGRDSRSSNLGRPNQPSGDFRTTKAGKMHGQDAKMMKNKVADRLGRHPEPNLPESFNSEYNDEAGMADNNLETMKRAVDGIDELISAGDNLPEWCQEKIAVAKSMLVTVWDYMASEEERGAEVNEHKKGVRAMTYTAKPRNFVAKNAAATTSGAGAHKDKKKAAKQGEVKHKNKEPAYESKLFTALENKLK